MKPKPYIVWSTREIDLKILSSLGKLPDMSCFYLAGGTALAEFYLGHPRSFDLDIFTAEEGLVRAFSHQAVEADRADRRKLCFTE